MKKKCYRFCENVYKVGKHLNRNDALVLFSTYYMIDKDIGYKDVGDRLEGWAITHPGFSRSTKPPVLPPTLLLAHLALGMDFFSML